MPLWSPSLPLARCLGLLGCLAVLQFQDCLTIEQTTVDRIEMIEEPSQMIAKAHAWSCMHIHASCQSWISPTVCQSGIAWQQQNGSQRWWGDACERVRVKKREALCRQWKLGFECRLQGLMDTWHWAANISCCEILYECPPFDLFANIFCLKFVWIFSLLFYIIFVCNHSWGVAEPLLHQLQCLRLQARKPFLRWKKWRKALGALRLSKVCLCPYTGANCHHVLFFGRHLAGVLPILALSGRCFQLFRWFCDFDGSLWRLLPKHLFQSKCSRKPWWLLTFTLLQWCIRLRWPIHIYKGSNDLKRKAMFYLLVNAHKC